MNTINVSASWFLLQTNEHAIVRKFFKDWATCNTPNSGASFVSYMLTFGKTHKIQVEWNQLTNIIHFEIPEDKLLLLELQYHGNY